LLDVAGGFHGGLSVYGSSLRALLVVSS
jgi:hypothetical protein